MDKPFSKEAQMRLKEFLISPSGQELLYALRAKQPKVCIGEQTHPIEFAALGGARVAGWVDCIKEIINLSTPKD